MSTWKWQTGVLNYSDKCAHCRESLRLRYHAGVVNWTDGYNYHLDCLLNRLVDYQAPRMVEAAFSGNQLPHWGILGGGSP